MGECHRWHRWDRLITIPDWCGARLKTVWSEDSYHRATVSDVASPRMRNSFAATLHLPINVYMYTKPPTYKVVFPMLLPTLILIWRGTPVCFNACYSESRTSFAFVSLSPTFVFFSLSYFYFLRNLMRIIYLV